ncbi:MAG: polysaccharide biosynthesis tyrosine autokinase [Planctomycetota bacterium]|nr:polysaccharide biosynthesis tyrosine autokinase [Planctomycetota bacterium]
MTNANSTAGAPAIGVPPRSGQAAPPAFGPGFAPHGGGGGAAATPTAAIDPFKLANKYKWILAAALIVGGLLGAGAHFLLMRFSPSYRPFALFECFLTQEDIGQPVSNYIVPKDDMERFMQTQVRIMTSSVVLRSVAEDSRLPREAPRWVSRFVDNGRVRTRDVVLRLQKDVGARAVPETRLIELSISYKNPTEATALVKMMREAYQTFVTRLGREQFAAQKEALAGEIADIDRTLANLQGQKLRMITDQKLDSLDDRAISARTTALDIDRNLTEIRLKRQEAEEQLRTYNELRTSPTGSIAYPDSMVSEVDKDPEIMEQNQYINNLIAQRMSMSETLGKEHRSIRQLEADLNAYRTRVQTMREEKLRKMFFGAINIYESAVRNLAAQEADLIKRSEDLRNQLVQLTGFQAQIDDMERQVVSLTLTRQEYDKKRNNIEALESLEDKQRIRVLAAEQIPDEVSFPKITVLVPLGVILTFGLTLGVVVLREVLDQRVKSAGDVALIPRTRVLGLVPEASEDHAGGGTPETAFRDRSKGVVAEGFRQVRGAVWKRMQQAGHRSVVIMAGMPGSGATTVTSNLAMASVSAGLRVLVIDANLRRPAIHRVFGVQEGPGLVDVLTGASLESTIQRTSDGKIAVLSAGSRDKRMVELLTTDAMSSLLAEAKGSFDIVLVDVSPALVSGDGFVLANKCDASVLVVRALSEKRGMVARIRNELVETRGEFLGVVVNAVRSAAGGYLKRNIKASADYHQAA